jgi:hypothetical protein
MEKLNYKKLMEKTVDSKKTTYGYELFFDNGDTLSINRILTQTWAVKIEISVNGLPWRSDTLRGAQLDYDNLSKSTFAVMFDTIERVHFKSKDKRYDEEKEAIAHTWSDLKDKNYNPFKENK